MKYYKIKTTNAKENPNRTNQYKRNKNRFGDPNQSLSSLRRKNLNLEPQTSNECGNQNKSIFSILSVMDIKKEI